MCQGTAGALYKFKADLEGLVCFAPSKPLQHFQEGKSSFSKTSEMLYILNFLTIVDTKLLFSARGFLQQKLVHAYLYLESEVWIHFASVKQTPFAVVNNRMPICAPSMDLFCVRYMLLGFCCC